jgi:hypothetical protein
LSFADLDHGQHSAFFDFAADNYRGRAGDPCEGKSPDRHAVFSPCHTGASDAAHSILKLISLTRSGHRALAIHRRHPAGAA